MKTHKKKRRPAASIGARIVEGLTQFKEALARKEPIAKKFTVRTVELDLEPQAFSPARVVRIREAMGVSQAVFAQLLGVSVHAVRAWEQGKREPVKMARRLLDEMNANPARWIKLLKEAAIRKVAAA